MEPISKFSIKWNSEKFQSLYEKNIQPFIEKKGGSFKASYVSWANAVRLVSEMEGADFSYKVDISPSGLPYFGEKEVGYFVSTSVSLFGETKSMILPVLDNNHNAVKGEAYEIKTKYSVQHVPAVDSFLINTAIMRCLVKNIALFGLGLSLYIGEDTAMYSTQESPAPNKKAATEKPSNPIFEKTPSKFINTIFNAGYEAAKNDPKRLPNLFATMAGYIAHHDLNIEVPAEKDAEGMQFMFDQLLSFVSATNPNALLPEIRTRYLKGAPPEFSDSPFESSGTPQESPAPNKKPAPDFREAPKTPSEPTESPDGSFLEEVQEAIVKMEEGSLNNQETANFVQKWLPIVSKELGRSVSMGELKDALYEISAKIESEAGGQ